MNLELWNVIGILVLMTLLVIWAVAHVKVSRRAAVLDDELRATRRALDQTGKLNASYSHELSEWRGLFGPFYSLYKNSPETVPGDNNDMAIAVDLDGVILQYVSPWNGIGHFGDVMPGAAEAMSKLRDMGYKVIVYTTRNNGMAYHNGGVSVLELTALVQAELERYSIPYDYIALFKPLARIYLDDRSLRFTDWAKALSDIGRLETNRLFSRIDQIRERTKGEENE